MSRIYVIQLNDHMTEEQYRILLSKLPVEKQKRIQNFVFRDDAIRSLVADLLVRCIIGKEFHIPIDKIQFDNNTFGKPFVEGLQSFHYNVSHSGHWIVCATDNQPVGIDIEQILPIDFDIANRFFTTLEIQDLEKKAGKAKLSYFYDLWSLKESYIKMVGKGLSIPLDSFSCRVMNNNVIFSSIIDQKSVYFKQYDLDPHYRLAVCQSHPYFSEDVHQISLKKMVSNILMLPNTE
jgi:4'-phosphopantetheinyl transferase